MLLEIGDSDQRIAYYRREAICGLIKEMSYFGTSGLPPGGGHGGSPENPKTSPIKQGLMNIFRVCESWMKPGVVKSYWSNNRSPQTENVNDGNPKVAREATSTIVDKDEKIGDDNSAEAGTEVDVNTAGQNESLMEKTIKSEDVCADQIVGNDVNGVRGSGMHVSENSQAVSDVKLDEPMMDDTMTSLIMDMESQGGSKPAEDAKVVPNSENACCDLFKVPSLPRRLSKPQAVMSLEEELACLDDANFDEIEMDLHETFMASESSSRPEPIVVEDSAGYGLSDIPVRECIVDNTASGYCNGATPYKRIKLGTSLLQYLDKKENEIIRVNTSPVKSLIKYEPEEEVTIIEERNSPRRLRYFPPRTVYDCDVCCFSKFKTEYDRIQHLMKQAQRPSWECETCGDSFTRPMELHRHKIKNNHQNRKRTTRSRLIELV